MLHIENILHFDGTSVHISFYIDKYITRFMTAPGGGGSPCFLYLHRCYLCMQPDIWTPPWAKGMSLTSKGKSDTDAHGDEFPADGTGSKHLAQTLF